MSVWKIFGIFFGINLFTVGGGYVMLPLLHDVFVGHYHLLTDREFLDAIALGQLTPGPLTLMNAFIGYKLAGFAGALFATAGTYLPSLLAVSVLMKYYLKVKESAKVRAVFSGITPAVIGMLLSVAFTMGRASADTPAGLAIGAAAFVLLSWTRIDPTFIILGSAAAGAIFL